MAEQARPTNATVDFLGLMTNVDPGDISDGGAEIQLNATCVTLGELRIRLGVREVTFED